LHILATTGSDQAGNLILGDVAYERFLESSRKQESQVLKPSRLEEAYPGMASEALAFGHAGSSAGGEFPKFTACRMIDGEPRHVIVKFSGAGTSAAETRWADLLVCEHIALDCMRERLQVPAASSALHKLAGRTFLEIVRFDRHGLLGRSEICSLSSIRAALVGSAETGWPVITRSLLASRLLDDAQAGIVDRSWWFGRLTGNTDMHPGNLSFVPGLVVAPAYDMLPMMYSPSRGGELPGAAFVVAEPLPRERGAWQAAAAVAVDYWRRCASDARVSDGFRTVCTENSSLLAKALNA
ncbi:MAG: HipA domain-containing protein, partial [Gammaproteobacteria bacterium]|nr:HipA domain-containing protein [Gammaproteobacteria bacterium]